MEQQIIAARYRVVRTLGEGKSGEVYLVEHVPLGRREALKVLKPELLARPELVARFRREARAMNRLRHPNIIGIHEFGRLSDGRVFLTMELVDGVNLRTALARGRMPVARAVALLRQLAAAIEHAHAQQVVHRDLKPANILLTTDGQDTLKVLDFGLARITSPEYQDSVGATRSGIIYGTPAYMSPEQVQGGTIDGRADIYSFGVIAFELVAGVLPFTGGTIEVMHAHVAAEPPSLQALVRDLPPGYEAVVRRCLAKDPLDRFHDGAELLDALGRIPAAGEELADTATITGTLADIGVLARAEAATTYAANDEQRAALHDALLELAEVLIDVGCTDLQLVIGKTQIREVDSDCRRLAREIARVDTECATAERLHHERIQAARFELGELCFARDQAAAEGRTVEVALAAEIAQLERRIASAYDELKSEITRLTNRSVAMTAELATREQKLARGHGRLDELLREVAAPFAADPRVQAARARVRARQSATSFATTMGDAS